MFKKLSFVIVLLMFTSCNELQQVVNNLPTSTNEIGLSQLQMANGLKEALDLGIEKQVSKLTAKDGFFRNELVKIILPKELQKVDKGLRDIGLGKLADEGLKVLNRAAENAVGKATPIFIDAVKNINFNDAKSILLGNDNAATNYLKSNTETALFASFKPVIKNSFSNVGADKIWNNLITKYNAIPFTKNVNPDLTSYVTAEALKGVYIMIEVEEKEIRTKTSSRATDLLKKVFALQD